MNETNDTKDSEFHVMFIVGGFAFDGTDPDDMILMDLCLEALAERDNEETKEAEAA